MIVKEKLRRFIYGLLLALVAANIPLYFVFVRPEGEAVSIEAQRMEQASRELREKKSAIDMVIDIEKKLAESRKARKEFEARYLFSRGKVSSELLNELDQICAQAGLLRNRVAFSYGAESEFGYQRLSLTLPVSGTYSNIRKFLNVLETRSKLIIVDSMVLQSEKEGTGLIQMDMNLSTYFPVQP
ncbi:MAG TPA: type 4a pilus biogenesis protein PilO [Terriglobia bacterium]|nr:type 4a pilus biogenesis protein PilO [Terriglobia bacterium]